MDKVESFAPVSVTDLLTAGVHFGHQTKRWNPKMKRYIFEKRAGIYIIDLTKTLVQLEQARRFLYETVAGGKNVLFVGTKRQGQDVIREAATRSGQFYVVSRWLGGTLTNFQNIYNSIRHMQAIQAMREKGELDTMPRKEASRLRHELERLERNLMGIAGMTSMPGAMVVIDVNREAIAVREAARVGIPVVATVDTNSDPDPITHVIPANDDSTRAIKLIVNVLADAIIKAGDSFTQARALQEQARQAEAASRPREAARASGRGFREKRPRRGIAAKGRPSERKQPEAPAAAKPEAPAAEAPATPPAAPGPDAKP